MIRYTEEEVEFNEVCHFRAEYDAYPSCEVTYFMDAELLFSDMSGGGMGLSVKRNEKLSNFKPDETDPYSSFKVLSTFKAKILNTHLGINKRYEYNH